MFFVLRRVLKNAAKCVFLLEKRESQRESPVFYFALSFDFEASTSISENRSGRERLTQLAVPDYNVVSVCYGKEVPLPIFVENMLEHSIQTKNTGGINDELPEDV